MFCLLLLYNEKQYEDIFDLINFNQAALPFLQFLCIQQKLWFRGDTYIFHFKGRLFRKGYIKFSEDL